MVSGRAHPPFQGIVWHCSALPYWAYRALSCLRRRTQCVCLDSCATTGAVLPVLLPHPFAHPIHCQASMSAARLSLHSCTLWTQIALWPFAQPAPRPNSTEQALLPSLFGPRNCQCSWLTPHPSHRLHLLHALHLLHLLRVLRPPHLPRACPPFAQYRGMENFARGEFRGGNSAVKKSGEILGIVPSFAAAAEELCFLRRAKRLQTRLSQPFLVQMYEIWCCRSGNWCWRYRPSLLWQCVAILESLSGACLVVFLQSFGRMAFGALGISRVAKLSPGETVPRQMFPPL